MIRDCSLGIYGYNSERRCALHGTPLTGRARTWCQPDRGIKDRGCWGEYARNHVWQEARQEALRLARFDTGRNRHYYCALCECLFNIFDVEVDHIEPARWAHGRHSCIHHQSNLRVLCIPCHRKVTAADASKRAEAARLKREQDCGVIRMEIP